jgi:hypothetical protein
MDTDRSTRASRSPASGWLSNRAIIGSGIAGGAVLAIASMFWAAPELVVRRSTGIGVEERSVEEEVQYLLPRAQYDEAIAALSRHLRHNESSERRISLYVCVLVLAGKLDTARQEIERLQCARKVMPIAHPDGENPADPPIPPTVEGPDFLEGRWEILDDDGSVMDRCTIERLCDGRAYLELRSGRRFAAVGLFLHDPARGQWTRALLTRRGTLAYYRGGFADGELTVRGQVTGSLGEAPNPFEMVFRRCDDGTIEWTHLGPSPGGAWRPVRVQTYRPLTEDPDAGEL